MNLPAHIKYTAPRLGRPRTNGLPREEQVRVAKRKQRRRDQDAGYVLYQIRLQRELAQRLRQALATPGFETELQAFLHDAVIDTRKFPNLHALCWNRVTPYITGRDAFGLYEGYWRFVDMKHISDTELALIRKLAEKFGNGLLNV